MDDLSNDFVADEGEVELNPDGTPKKPVDEEEAAAEDEAEEVSGDDTGF